MKFPRALGDGVWHLCTTYSVIPAKIFKRRNKIVVRDQLKKETEDKAAGAVVVDDYSPYAQFEDPHSTPGSNKINHDHTSTTLSLTSGISRVTAESCLGHFEDCLALPIALMAAYMLDLGA